MNLRDVIEVMIYFGGESGYAAECVNLPVVTQGPTVDESLSNLREAVGLMLADETLTDWNLAPNPTILAVFEV